MDCVISSNGRKSLPEIYCAVLGIVANVVSLIDSLGGAMRTVSNKRSRIPFWKKYDMVVSLNSENGTKVANIQNISIFQQRR